MTAIDPSLLEQLRNAIIQGDLATMHTLFSQGIDINSPLNANETPFTVALLYRQWEAVRYLLAQGASFRKRLIYGYYTPLGWVCISGQVALCQDLLAAGADPQEVSRYHKTPLHWAVESGNSDMVRLILAQNVDLNFHKADVEPPLFTALRYGYADIVHLLIQAGADLAVRDTIQNTVLHAVVQSNQPALLAVMLQHPHAIDACNQQQQTALHIAAQLGKLEMVQGLVSAGAATQMRDANNDMPLTASVTSGSVPVFDYLLAQSHHFSQEQQQWAMRSAIRSGLIAMVQRLLTWFDLKAPLSETHPLMMAIACKQETIVWLLLQAGTPVDADYQGQSLLLWSIQQAHPRLATYLLAAGAQVGRAQAITWLDNLLYLRKSAKVIWPAGTDELSGDLLIALQKNLESLGFMLSPALAERVLTFSKAQVADFYQTLIPCLRHLVGADKPYQPMYPHFPEQVKAMSTAELYWNAMLHYWGDAIGRRIMPHYDKAQRAPLADKTNLRPIDLGDQAGLMQLFAHLLQARSALRPEDKEDLKWFVSSRGDAIGPWLPAEIPQRENAALLVAALLSFTTLQTHAAGYLKNGVDVLRVATALSDGDVSLTEPTRFRSFAKALRRWLLAQLERMPLLAESLWRHPETFKRLGERLHPGEYRQQFPKTWAAFQTLRQGQKPPTFARQVETQLAAKQPESILDLLRSRPGEFARRLDHVLRISQQPGMILAAFRDVVQAVPTPLLLQLMNHFQNRLSPPDLRVFFPKGDLAKLQAIDYALPPLPPEWCQTMVTLCRKALLKHYSTRSPLGLCYLDERLKDYTVPFALRSASKALQTIGRGSRLALPPSDTVRFFIWWKDGRERTDLDLSALALDENFEYQTTLAYYNLKDLGGCHSGDITSAPEGASEFIDVEIQPFLSRGTRYVMMVVNSFTTQPYCDLPECFAGFMMRQTPNSGEIYDPRTVVNKFDLTANSTISVPLILDLYDRQVIWTDLSLTRNPATNNHVHGNRSSLSILCAAMAQLRKPNLYDLFAMHVEARGVLVPKRQAASTVFATERIDAKNLTPFDIPVIISEYL